MLVEHILIDADLTEDGPPFNQFYDDELRKSSAHRYRLLQNRVPYWRKTLESIKATQRTVWLEASLREQEEELEALIRDAEIEMNLPAFYHRMSERNQQGKDNVRGDTLVVSRNVRLALLIQEHREQRQARYTLDQAIEVVLDLFPPDNKDDPDASPNLALRRRITAYRSKRKQS
jgi:hypothetical protein